MKECCIVWRVPSAEMHRFFKKLINLLATQLLMFHTLTHVFMEV